MYKVLELVDYPPRKGRTFKVIAKQPLDIKKHVSDVNVTFAISSI